MNEENVNTQQDQNILNNRSMKNKKQQNLFA